jgi:hypothetical protein
MNNFIKLFNEIYDDEFFEEKGFYIAFSELEDLLGYLNTEYEISSEQAERLVSRLLSVSEIIHFTISLLKKADYYDLLELKKEFEEVFSFRKKIKKT